VRRTAKKAGAAGELRRLCFALFRPVPSATQAGYFQPAWRSPFSAGRHHPARPAFEDEAVQAEGGLGRSPRRGRRGGSPWRMGRVGAAGAKTPRPTHPHRPPEPAVEPHHRTTPYARDETRRPPPGSPVTATPLLSDLTARARTTAHARTAPCPCGATTTLTDRPDGTVVRHEDTVAKAHAPNTNPTDLTARLTTAARPPRHPPAPTRPHPPPPPRPPGDLLAVRHPRGPERPGRGPLGSGGHPPRPPPPHPRPHPAPTHARPSQGGPSDHQAPRGRPPPRSRPRPARLDPSPPGPARRPPARHHHPLPRRPAPRPTRPPPGPRRPLAADRRRRPRGRSARLGPGPPRRLVRLRAAPARRVDPLPDRLPQRRAARPSPRTATPGPPWTYRPARSPCRPRPWRSSRRSRRTARSTRWSRRSWTRVTEWVPYRPSWRPDSRSRLQPTGVGRSLSWGNTKMYQRARS
jgi:hypothetical protein